MISVHDYEVISYEVNLRDHFIIIKTKHIENKVLIEFTDVLAHLFEDHLHGSVLLEIEKYTIEAFIEGNLDLLERHKPHCWPTYFNSLDEFREMLESIKYFV